MHEAIGWFIKYDALTIGGGDLLWKAAADKGAERFVCELRWLDGNNDWHLEVLRLRLGERLLYVTSNASKDCRVAGLTCRKAVVAALFLQWTSLNLIYSLIHEWNKLPSWFNHTKGMHQQKGQICINMTTCSQTTAWGFL